MHVDSAELVGPDELTLRLAPLFVVSTPVDYERIDTYQKYGSRIRLMRSEIVRSSSDAQQAGLGLGLVVANGLSPGTPNASSYQIVQAMERCTEE